MFDIGFWEILVIALVALIVVGPERLPNLIRVTGLWIGRAQASLHAIKTDISRELRAQELKDALNKTNQTMSDMNQTIHIDESLESQKKTENTEETDKKDG